MDSDEWDSDPEFPNEADPDYLEFLNEQRYYSDDGLSTDCSSDGEDEDSHDLVEGKKYVKVNADYLTKQNPYPLTALEMNMNLLRNSEDYDVVFIVGKEQKQIKCHKLFLGARSQVFEAEFSKRWNPSEKLVSVQLPEEDPVIFQAFLEFIYADKFKEKESFDSVRHLLRLADLYDIQPLWNKCKEYMMKNYTDWNNAVGIRDEAVKYSWNGVKRKVNFFISSNISDLLTHPVLANTAESTLIRLLAWDSIQAPEIVLFRIARRWAKIQMEKNQELQNKKESEVLRGLLPVIRFPLMTAEDFAKEVVPTEILPTDTVLELFKYICVLPASRSSERLSFSTHCRGIQRTVMLYKTGSESMDMIPKYPTNYCAKTDLEVSHRDVLKFQFESLAVPVNRSLVITGFLLRGPRIPGIHDVDHSDNCGLQVRITLAEKVSKVKRSFDVVLRSGSRTEYNLPCDQFVPLVHNYRYRITVSDNSQRPMFIYAKPGRINQRLDLSTLATLQKSCVDTNKLGRFELREVEMVKKRVGLTKPYVDLPKKSYRFHVVQGIKVAYF